MSLQFIENSKIDGSTRKLIRSHVMRGKNAGKTLPRSTRKNKQTVSSIPRIAPKLSTPPLPHDTAPYADSVTLSIPRTPGSMFSLLSFPGDVQAYGSLEKLIYQFMVIATTSVYPTGFCLPIDTQKSLWVQYLVSDEAFFYSTLAMSEVSMDSLLGKQETSPRALQHLSNAYRCVRQNIQKDKMPSHSTIAAVMSMAIHEDLRGHSERSKIHVDALYHLIELRGGLDDFEPSSVLLQKICRADLEYALHSGSSPRLNRDKFPREFICQSMLSQDMSQLEILDVMNDVQFDDIVLRNVFVDLISVTRLLNCGHTCFRMNPYAYQEVLISVLYRLLLHRPLDNRNALHLGLLAMITTLFFQFGRSERLSYDLLAEKFRIAIESRINNGLPQDSFLLWLLFIGGISVFRSSDETWLYYETGTCLSTLHIDSWSKAKEEIQTFPWINTAHDNAGQRMWQDMLER